MLGCVSDQFPTFVASKLRYEKFDWYFLFIKKIFNYQAILDTISDDAIFGILLCKKMRQTKMWKIPSGHQMFGLSLL